MQDSGLHQKWPLGAIFGAKPARPLFVQVRFLHKKSAGFKIAWHYRGGFIRLCPPRYLRAGGFWLTPPRPASFSQWIETSVTFLWYGLVASDGLRSNGVDDLPPSTSQCSILPIARLYGPGSSEPPARALGQQKEPRPLLTGPRLVREVYLSVHPKFIASSYRTRQVNDPLRIVASKKGGRHIACNSIDNFQASSVT